LKEADYTSTVTIEREIEGPEQRADILQSIGFLQNLIDRTYS
jgi:hypothetical protein